MSYVSLEGSFYSGSSRFSCIKIYSEMVKKSQVKYRVFIVTINPICMRASVNSLFKYGYFSLINHTKWWVIKVKHPSLALIMI